MIVWSAPASATGEIATLSLPVGSHTVVLTVTDEGELSHSDEVTVTVNAPANVAPVADAGADQTIIDADRNGTEQVTFDGSGSADEDGSITSYSWSINGEERATGINPTITLGAGTHTVLLKVTDNNHATDTDEVTVTIQTPLNLAPEADAGADQILVDTDRNKEEAVTLNASGSKDPDGSISSYSWSVNGEEIATGVKPTITLPLGSTTVLLTVKDQGGLTDTDEVRITINAPANEAPVANAGADQTILDTDGNGLEAVSLNASGSTDVDDNINSYSWAVGGELKATGVNPTINLGVGTHRVVLTVTDKEGLSSTDEVVITIKGLAVLSLSAGSGGTEGGKNGSFVLNSSRALEKDVTVSFSLGGTAGAGVDYTSPGTKVVLKAGQTSQSIPIVVLDDAEVEREESVILSLTKVTGSQEIVIGEESSATISIKDNEGCFTVSAETGPASCSNTADGKIDITIAGSSGDLVYSWSNGFTGEDLQNVSSGTYQVEITDRVSGCSLEQEFTLDVLDNVPPIAKGKTLTLQLNQEGQATLVAKDLNNGSTDNCGIKKFSASKTTFSCADLGENEVVLTVEDVNGNKAATKVKIMVEDMLPPIFASGQQFSIPEDAPLNSQVGVVEASDNCQPLKWEIAAGNDDGLFQLSQQGQIITKGQLDYEIQKKYTLTIRVSAGGYQVIEVVSILLENIDDPGPDIGVELEEVQSLSEDDHFTYIIPQNAFEVPDNEEITFSAYGTPPWLSFDPANLRFEGTPGNEDVGEYMITVRGTDSQGRFAEQHFTLAVANTNDAPHALSLSRNQVLENQPEGTFIGHISHEDVDMDDEHTYQLVPGEGDSHNSFFRLNGSDLLTAKPLDFETDSLVSIRLAVIDKAGASFEKAFMIEVGNDEDGTAFLPNLFSPNGDNMNDYLIIRASQLKEVHWRIYNRQGRLVYETKDITEATQVGWDGTSSGEPQPEGSYMWVLEAYYNDGRPLLINDKQMGSVTLIR